MNAETILEGAVWAAVVFATLAVLFSKGDE